MNTEATMGAQPVQQPALGHDGRKWHTVPTAAPCHCGSTPIAARSVSGWTLMCPTDAKHGHVFEQWMHKCKRKWLAIQAAAQAA